MSELFDFEWYSRKCLKISTKLSGLMPFTLRKAQRRYNEHLRTAFPNGIIRSLCLKPRQAGWSTFIAGKCFHNTATTYGYKTLVMADKFDRTNEVYKIYKSFYENLPLSVKPAGRANDDGEIKLHILGSYISSETAQDRYAGRSTPRRCAHLSEYAFYPYPMDIDDGVQNSIPLASGTAIFKESTANGMSGDGKAFYNLWLAAEAGDSIYKPFFVAWYEIEDYAIDVPHGFFLKRDEIELIKTCPEITNANLAWRRLKLSEYLHEEGSILTPEERFKQDFPSYPEEAFRSTGRPVFDQEKLKKHINLIRQSPPSILNLVIKKPFLSMYPHMLTLFKAPEAGKKFIIGADVSEGVSSGDFSHAFIMSAEGEQVGFFHGHLDPDHFGEILVELGNAFNKALLVPEINNMGHTTLTAIKRRDYLHVYMRQVFDEIADEETDKMGWRTTSANKQSVISKLISAYRDSEIRILDINLLREMMSVTREDNGDIRLTGKDRVVAACLAREGLVQLDQSATVHDPNKKKKLFFEERDESRVRILEKEKEL